MNTELLPDEWAISPAPHLGDTYITCALAEAFLKRHGGSRVRVVVPNRFWKTLNLFPDARIAPLDPGSVSAPFRKERGFRLQEPFYLRPPKFWSEFESAYHGQSLPFTRTYHDLLDLPFPSFAKPRVTQQVRDSADQLFREYGLPAGRTVILFPLTSSLVSFPESLWAQVALGFAARGFTVTTNLVNEFDFCIPGTSALRIPIDELIPVCEMAGTVVAARSGVCDVISSAQVDLRILYQRQDLDWSPLAGVTLQWDLGPCGLGDHATNFRMDVSESPSLFVERILAGPQ